jgi:sugar O-acyltransferase (sialic acid O-acetyltransferase NeuD family)
LTTSSFKEVAEKEFEDEKIVLQGGGDHARVVLDALLDQQRNVIGIFDPNQRGVLFGVKQLGAYRSDFETTAMTIISIGDNAIRKKIASASRHAFTKVVHRSAEISRFATVGNGSMVLHRSVVQAQSVIGEHVIVNTGAQIDHDCTIGDFAHIAPGSVLCGTVTVGEGTFVGAGSVIIPKIKVGKWCIIGAGSVVIRDVPDYTMVLGNPARAVKNLNHG